MALVRMVLARTSRAAGVLDSHGTPAPPERERTKKAAGRRTGRLSREGAYLLGFGVGNVTEPLVPALVTAVCTNVANCDASVNPPE